MSDDTIMDETSDSFEDQIQSDGLRKHVKRIETENRELKQQMESARSAQRELALIKAGVDISSPTGRLFAKAYDGELDVDAVKTAAMEYGVVSPPAATSASPEEQAAWSRTQSAQAAGSPAGEIDWKQRLDAAKTQDEAWAVLEDYDRAMRTTQL
jgi:23S rRNA U2552 (ribose-2'-O)-methylase RlmE/FtsJ